jgi:hypothetical protein
MRCSEAHFNAFTFIEFSFFNVWYSHVKDCPLCQKLGRKTCVCVCVCVCVSSACLLERVLHYTANL